ncbi:MAG: hypothetical protein HF962_08425, partial [Sulfurovum sp.]|nr:hypothetical protein [Sulfurovum sp.]
LIMSFCSANSTSLASKSKYKSVDQFPVLSYNLLETKKINKQIYEAVKNREEWPDNPLLIVSKYHQNIGMSSFVSIVAKSPGGEGYSTSTVTVVESGYLDDSVRGGWFQFYLDRNNAAFIWEVKEIRQANLCGRMNSPNEFSKENCP